MKSWPVAPALVLACSLPLFASSKEQRARGAQLFTSSGCLHCHTIGNAGGHRGPNLSGVGRTVKKSAMRDHIVHGSQIMPAFGDVLDAQEIDDLVAYLRSCRAKSTR